MMTFTGQNMGAGKLDRVKKVLGTACGLATAVSLALGVVFVLFSSQLCGLVTDNPEVIAIAKTRMTLLCLTYFTSSLMEVFNSSLSSMGWHRSTMYVGFFCGLGARVLWAKGIWPMLGTLATLYISFPVSNLLAIGVYLLIFRHAMRVLEARYAYKKLEI
jgi:Na+-driven multidrug efflux pump